MTVCMVSSLTPTALFLESSKVTEEWLFKKKKNVISSKTPISWKLVLQTLPSRVAERDKSSPDTGLVDPTINNG